MFKSSIAAIFRRPKPTTERPTSDHFDGKLFVNTTMVDINHGFFKGLRMWLRTKKAKWPIHVDNKVISSLPKDISESELCLTFINHVTFLIQYQGLNILTDPIWSKRASPFSFLGPARVRKPGIAFEDLPPIDIVLISHNHYDHLDLETLDKLNQKFKPQFFVALGDKALLQSIGCKRVQELDWWQSIQINATTTITFTPTQHFSARGLFDQRCSLWGGYMIQHQNHLVYFGGDAGYSTHFRDIFKKFGAVDIALLGIGAYEPRWFMSPMHTNPEEAVLAHIDLQAKLSIGMHFGTFQLSTEAFEQPVHDLKVALQKYNINEEAFITLNEGESRWDQVST